MNRVIFRKFKEGDIIAFLPDAGVDFGKIMSYQHIGQHGEADFNIAGYTKPAKPGEYADLLRELKEIGYKPKVFKRLQHKWLNWIR